MFRYGKYLEYPGHMYADHTSYGRRLRSEHPSDSGSDYFRGVLRSAGLLLFRRNAALSFRVQNKQRGLRRGPAALYRYSYGSLVCRIRRGRLHDDLIRNQWRPA